MPSEVELSFDIPVFQRAAIISINWLTSRSGLSLIEIKKRTWLTAFGSLANVKTQVHSA